ncbi:ABC transporter type 1, transmembrane domain-containing protein [Aspergillus carlsbadensis]|nr:ABC transporter type 1, transmembrane domain-containing protein [Aspergillus carlsbadensis]
MASTNPRMEKTEHIAVHPHDKHEKDVAARPLSVTSHAVGQSEDDLFAPLLGVAPYDGRRLVTIRAIITGGVLGSLIACSNLYLGLKTGFGADATLFSAIFGFGICKMLEKSNLPFLGGEFGPHENNIIQATSLGCIGVGFMFMSGVPAMYQLQLLGPTPQSDYGRMLCLTVVGGFWGLGFAVPLRRLFILKLARQLSLNFPLGTASAVTIRAMHAATGQAAAATEKIKTIAISFSVSLVWSVGSAYAPGILYQWNPFWWIYTWGGRSIVGVVNWGWLSWQWSPSLAAVDAKVRAHLVEQVLGPNGILKDALRIVTTSSDSLMSQADVLYVVRDGTLSEAAQPQPSGKGTAYDRPEVVSQSQVRLQEALPRSAGYGSILPATSMQPATSNSGAVTTASPLLAETGTTSHTAELRHTAVGFETYLRFLKLAKHGGWLVVLVVAAASKLVDILAVYFLKVFSQEFEAQSHSVRLVYYSICALCGGALSAIFVLVAYALCVIPTSRSIHAELTEGVLESKFSFFDSTSLGQILNRFTSDINKIDSSVSGGLISLVALSVTATASILVIVAATPLSVLYLAPIGGVYFAIQAYYQHACRQLRRLEMLARGPILNAASEMRVGAAVIKTFGQQDCFRRRAGHAIDHHVRVWLPFVALDSWLLLRLQVLSSIIQLLSAILLLYLQAPPSTLGLVLTYLIQTTSQFTSLAQMRADLEADMTSVERVWTYASNEPEHEPVPDSILPANWPQSPSIAFSRYTASYAPSAPPCLSDLTFTIHPGDHIAVVGRTDAGKSSLTLALLRALEGASSRGSIIVDGWTLHAWIRGTCAGA